MTIQEQLDKLRSLVDGLIRLADEGDEWEFVKRVNEIKNTIDDMSTAYSAQEGHSSDLTELP